VFSTSESDTAGEYTASIETEDNDRGRVEGVLPTESKWAAGDPSLVEIGLEPSVMPNSSVGVKREVNDDECCETGRHARAASWGGAFMPVGLRWGREGRMTPTLDGTRRVELAPTWESMVRSSSPGPPMSLNRKVPGGRLERRRVQFLVLTIISSP